MRHWLWWACLAEGALFGAPAAEWTLPSPEKTEPPGAKDAPAGDPRTYPDAEGFQARAKLILEGLAVNDLSQWRKGYFTGGDPGKYLPCAAMAKLLLNPGDETVRRFMNDDRSHREHYHFAAVNWARLLPVFAEVLTPETRKGLAEQAARYGSYLSPAGTENHKTMWMTSANVLPHFLEGGRLSTHPKEAALAKAKELLRQYAKGLFAAGQGEWDSSTYLIFDLNGMLNIYDFSPDPECRLMAKAVLDWYAAAYALKYTDGLYCAPNQRGFAAGPVKKLTDHAGWLWWDSHADLKPKPGADGAPVPATKDFLFAIHAVTSSWRPNKVLTNLARRKVGRLPFEQRNSKPNYWYGLRLTPEPNHYQESVYVTRHYTLGSLWEGGGGQISRFQLAAAGPKGGVSFTGGHPTEWKYEDGNGKYDQSAQCGGTYLSLCAIPEDEPLAYSFFSAPDEATAPVRKGAWWVMQAGGAYLGIHPLSAESALGESDLGPREKEANAKAKEQGKEPRHRPFPILRFAGRLTGFVLETSDSDNFPSLEAFAEALQGKVRVELDAWAASRQVTVKNLAGRSIVARRGKAGRAEVQIDGRPMTFESWPVYDGPYLRQKDSVLSVNDGAEGFVVDFSGALPVYKPWEKP